ncbi:GNAT family N-acetyltransferase [Microbacterium sp. cx-55]|uniref:GNAT family N-acetyltransferase n=1 Tax=Microbacterium sp. cx-55 TaxID=2875948 RepID=UPI001CBCE639|nr:GNAT family N-acetyltransferase [Microbacterium sp. cx-55]MBZ4488595.1 GNAT family N-acetyltransferase [Microbacterium sp. cx-55]UGB36174.1 GNAT family N-acetyltransferase [Microbacterium sp. cx-55]
MLTVRAVAADSPAARGLLDEYFAMRAAGFPGGAYRTTYPDPAAFVPPAGVFVIAEDDAGAARGCGGIRRIPDGPSGLRYEVKHLFMQPSARGLGGGRILLTALEAKAREFGAADLVLDTHHSLDAAAGLYASSGFAAILPYNDNANATRWYGKPLT